MANNTDKETRESTHIIDQNNLNYFRFRWKK